MNKLKRSISLLIILTMFFGLSVISFAKDHSFDDSNKGETATVNTGDTVEVKGNNDKNTQGPVTSKPPDGSSIPIPETTPPPTRPHVDNIGPRPSSYNTSSTSSRSSSKSMGSYWYVYNMDTNTTERFEYKPDGSNLRHTFNQKGTYMVQRADVRYVYNWTNRDYYTVEYEKEYRPEGDFLVAYWDSNWRWTGERNETNSNTRLSSQSKTIYAKNGNSIVSLNSDFIDVSDLGRVYGNINITNNLNDTYWIVHVENPPEDLVLDFVPSKPSIDSELSK